VVVCEKDLQDVQLQIKALEKRIEDLESADAGTRKVEISGPVSFVESLLKRPDDL